MVGSCVENGFPRSRTTCSCSLAKGENIPLTGKVIILIKKKKQQHNHTSPDRISSSNVAH